MTKDCRIVVRMSELLRDWVHEQASAREMDDAAYVRMLLAEARSGVTETRIKAEAPAVVMMPQPVRRDVLDVATTADPVIEAAAMVEQPVGAAHTIDLDSLVDDALKAAEAEGLTEPQIEAGQGEMPESGVRAIMRRPVPFSPGSQHARIEQLLGAQG